VALALGLAVAPLALLACGEDATEPSGEVTLVATTTHVADIARTVGGERARVVGLLPANADPHDYEPVPSDAEALADASLVIRSGGDLDAWADGLVESSGTDAEVLELLDHVTTIAGSQDHEDDDRHVDEEGDEHSDDEGDEHADDDLDPHWWQDPRNAVTATQEIAEHLSEVDPDGAAGYQAAAAAYTKRIEALDAAIARCMAAIPAGDRKLVTSHDSLGYLAARYSIEVVGAANPALSTQAQPSAGAVADLVELIRTENVRAVFPEAGLSQDLERAIADQAGVTVGGELYADTLGPAGSGADTYLGSLALNAETLAAGFSGDSIECELPE